MIKNLTLTICLSLLLLLLFKLGLVHEYFVSSSNEIFADWRNYIVRGMDCKSQGFNIFHENNCQRVNYGLPLFYLPYDTSIRFVYDIYVPIILIFTLILLITFIINSKSLIEILILILALTNPSTLLLLERLNIDIILFILLIILVYSRNYIVDTFLLVVSFLLKYYPIIYFIKIFAQLNNNSYKILIKKIFLPIALIILFCFYLGDNLISITQNISHSKAGLHYLFSIKAIPKIINYQFEINYILLNFFNFCFFIIVLIVLYNNLKKYNLNINLNYNNFYNLLFLIAGNTLIFCYLTFSNYYYREIFLIAIIPQLFLLKKNKPTFFINLIIMLIIFRYFYLYFYGYALNQNTFYYSNNMRIYTDSFVIAVLIKSIFDFILMIFLTFLLLKPNYKIFKNFFHSLKRVHNKT